MRSRESWRDTACRVLAILIFLCAVLVAGNWALLVMIEHGLYSALIPYPYYVRY